MCPTVYGIHGKFHLSRHVTRLCVAENWNYQTNLAEVSHIVFEKICEMWDTWKNNLLF
jgi:hypothetical protein